MSNRRKPLARRLSNGRIAKLPADSRVSASEFSAGKRWMELGAAYSVACRSPRQPKTVAFDAPGGQPIDPDSDAGEAEAKRHQRASAEWLLGRDTLRRAGTKVERVVEDVCMTDQMPAGFDELKALRDGLSALTACWTARRKR